MKVVSTILVAVLAAVLIVPSFINWNRYKNQITEPIERLTGRKLNIDGDVSFTVLPSPAFSAQGLSFANVADGRAAYLASVESLDIRLSFLPLLGGRIQVESIALNHPVLALEVRDGERPNWRFHAPDLTPSTANEPETDVGVNVRFEQVVIENGIVTYHDIATGSSLRLEDISATVSATSLDGPFAAKGNLNFQDLPVDFQVLVGNLVSGRAVPVSFSLALLGEAANLTFAGWASEPNLDARFNGRATVEGTDLADTIGKIMGAIDGAAGLEFTSTEAAKSSFSAEAQVVASSNEGRLRNLTVQLGDDTATGGLHVTLGEHSVFDGNLNINSIDLDRWLTMATREIEPVTEDNSTSGEVTNEGPAYFDLPGNVSGTFKVSVGAVIYNNGIARQIRLALRMGDGRIGIENGSVLLPGGSAVDVAGIFSTDGAEPHFSGRLTATSDNIRKLLSWLDVGVDTATAGQFTNLSFSSSLEVSPKVIQVFGIDARLDAMHATGGIFLAVSDRLAFGLDLSVDEIDVDRYFGATLDSTAPEQSNIALINGGSTIGNIKKQLKGLNEFDANIRLKLGRIAGAGYEIKDTSFDGAIYDGEITINELKIGNYLGARGALSGTARDLSRRPTADLKLEFNLSDADTLQRLFNLAPSAWIARFGAGSGTLRLKGDEGRVTVNLDGYFSGTHLTLDGGIVAPTAAPVIDAKARVENRSLAAIIEQFEIPMTPPQGQDDGPLSVSISASGKVDNLELQSSMEVGGGNASLNGHLVHPFTDPDYSFLVAVKASDLKKFVRGLGADFQAAANDLGGLEGSISVSGNHLQADIKNFEGHVGPIDFKGAARVRLTGDQPHVNGTLETSEINMNKFMSVPSTGVSVESNTSNGGGKWSRSSFDLAFMNNFNGELRLRAPMLTIGEFSFYDLRTTLTLDDGMATLAPLEARLFDGEAELGIKLSARRTPELNLRLSLTNADLAAALSAVSGLEAITGRAGVSGEFHTLGHNQLEMIAALEGGARISAREGVIQGIDLPRLSERLNNINDIKDVLGMVAGSLTGGRTTYRSVEGAVEVNNGVVRTTDVRADVDAVETSFTSEWDLVNWTMNTEAQFRLTDHPQAPNVGIDWRGSIDSPRRGLKTRKLESYLTKRLAAAMLNKLVSPTSEAQPAGAASVPEQSPPATVITQPEDVLRDLLNALP